MNMEFPIPFLCQNNGFSTIDYTFPSSPSFLRRKKLRICCFSMPCPPTKSVRNVGLDKHVVQHNFLLFVHKLKALILSDPTRCVPVEILSKYRSHLALSNTASSVHAVVLKYPSVFQLMRVRRGMNSKPQLCVSFTPEASVLAGRENDLQLANSEMLAVKLQKLLMISCSRRLLLNKLVHLSHDLGLPANFRSTICYRHPEKFKVIDTSYGKAIELVEWDPGLAMPMPFPNPSSYGLITDRPLRFNNPRMRKGFILKRRHEEFLIKLGEDSVEWTSPYTPPANLRRGSPESEKRACGVLREVLGMTISKRTLIDHLAIFRGEFGLPNNLRGLILRHPEFFYVSHKGLRDSVLLQEAYDDNGALIDRDEILAIHDQLARLAAKSKEMKRRTKGGMKKKKIPVLLINELGDGLDDVIESQDSCVFAFDDYVHVISSSEEPW